VAGAAYRSNLLRPTNPGACRRESAPPAGMSPNVTAPNAGRLFFPQSRALGIDQGNYSPELLKTIVYAGTQLPSFAQGSAALEALGKLNVSTKQVERLTAKIGQERVDQRDEAVANFLELPLMDRCKSPIANPPPASTVAAVMMDGGRLQILDRSKQDTDRTEIGEEDSSPERTGHWREDKIGLLLTMTSEVSTDDPCPEIPENFIDPTRIFRLAREIKGHIKGAADDSTAPPEAMDDDDTAQNNDTAAAIPKPRVRTMVATRKPAERFGEIPAWAAWLRGFAAAVRKAFIADGASVNWTIHKQWFSDYVAILDFIHALSYVFASAMAGRGFGAGWEAFCVWIQLVWSGRVEEVITALEIRQAELGPPEESDGETSPRRVVAEALTYLRNNKDRMRYDEYRKAGLPITSSHMESTVKLFNRRVKGTEKFWSEEGAEAILELRADHLSETEPLEAFWQSRQASATGQRSYRRCG
jgi:hypothetical protein